MENRDEPGSNKHKLATKHSHPGEKLGRHTGMAYVGSRTSKQENLFLADDLW